MVGWVDESDPARSVEHVIREPVDANLRGLADDGAADDGAADDGAADDGVGDNGLGDDGVAERALPDAALKRAVALAAELLGSMPTTDIPPALRRVAKFAPSRRARLGAAAIAGALAADVAFRQRAGELATARWPSAAAVLHATADPASADAVELAALAYLTRPSGWSSVVSAARERLDVQASRQLTEERLDQTALLRAQLEALRASSLAGVSAAKAEYEKLKAANTKLEQQLGASREAARIAERRVADAGERAAEAAAAAATALRDSEAESRRLRARVLELEATVESNRRAAREGRTTESIRARLLLDTMVEAARGLRHELALPAVVTRPADLVTTAEPDPNGEVMPRGRGRDDPGLLRQLLELPLAHLVVDGYNVTKTGYPELPLDAQRARLLAGLGALAARTAAEVTVVFDGAALDGTVRVMSPASVRVRFSPPGVTADDVIRDLVRAEPVGRAVVVVSSDREVADGVRRTAHPMAATALLRLLDGR